MKRRNLATFLAGFLFACAPGVVNESDVHPPSGTQAPTPSDGGPPPTQTRGDYEYVARRGHSSIAVAEARGPEHARVVRAVDRASDQFAQCLQGLPPERHTAEASGAARVILRLSAEGDVVGERVVVGENSAYIVVRCLLPALKIQAYGPTKIPKDSRLPGIAFEAVWE